MVKGQANLNWGRVAQKWAALAERRCDFFAQLYHTGRWKLYCNEEELFASRMQEVMNIAKRWRGIAPSPTAAETEQTPIEPYKTAA